MRRRRPLHERIRRRLAEPGHDPDHGFQNTLIIVADGGGRRAGAGHPADDSPDVAPPRLHHAWPRPMSTPCAACRSCCSSICSISACRRFGLRFDNWSAGIAALTLYTLGLYGRAAARGMGGPAEGADRGRPRFWLLGLAAVPPHHSAAGAVLRAAFDRQPVDPDRQRQRLPHHHRRRRTDPSGDLVADHLFRAVRVLHGGGRPLLGDLRQPSKARSVSSTALPRNGADAWHGRERSDTPPLQRSSRRSCSR